MEASSNTLPTPCPLTAALAEVATRLLAVAQPAGLGYVSVQPVFTQRATGHYLEYTLLARPAGLPWQHAPVAVTRSTLAEAEAAFTAEVADYVAQGLDLDRPTHHGDNQVTMHQELEAAA